MQFTIGLIVGGAAVWLLKDKIATFVTGAETQIRALEDKIKALKAKL